MNSQGDLDGFVVSDEELSEGEMADLQVQKDNVIKKHVYHPESFRLVVRDEMRLATFPGDAEEPGVQLARQAIYGGLQLLGWVHASAHV